MRAYHSPNNDNGAAFVDRIGERRIRPCLLSIEINTHMDTRVVVDGVLRTIFSMTIKGHSCDGYLMPVFGIRASLQLGFEY